MMSNNLFRNVLIGAGALVVVAILILAFVLRFTVIQPGNVGIKIDLLGETRTVENVDIVVGRVFYFPISQMVIQYPYITQRFEWWGPESLKFNSTEGVRLGVDVSISMGVDPDRAAELYIKYRRTLDQMIDNEIRDRVNGCMSLSASRMRVDRIVGDGRSEFLTNTVDCINERLVTEGWILNDFQLTSNFEIPQNIQSRIDEQIQAQQQAIAAENTVRQREAEARQRVAQAQGEAEARVLQATADADARLLAATAEAQALTIQGEALRTNPEVLQLNFIQQWNGQLPLVTGGTDGLLLDIDSLIGNR